MAQLLGFSVKLYRNSDGSGELIAEGWSREQKLDMAHGFVSFHPDKETSLTTVYYGLDLFDHCVVEPIYQEKEA